MRATLLGAWLAGALLLHVVAHVALVAGLSRRDPRWRALAALFIPPLAPAWGWGEGMRGRVYAWAIGVAAFAVATALGR